MSSFKFNQLLFVSVFAFASANVARASDTLTRGHVVTASQTQVEIQLNDNQTAHEGVVYKVTHYRAGPPKDPTSNVYLFAGRVRVTMPMGDGRAHAQVMDGHPAAGDTVWEESPAASATH